MVSIRDIRLVKKLSQKEISKKLNISQNTYSQYENKKRQPSLEILKSLKQILNCSYDDLIDSLLQENKGESTCKKISTN